MERDRLAQLLTSKVSSQSHGLVDKGNLQSIILGDLAFKRCYGNCLSKSSNFMNTPGKTRQSVQSDTRITELSDVHQWIQWHQHQNERTNPTLAIYGREITDNPKLCFCPNVELSSGLL